MTLAKRGPMQGCQKNVPSVPDFPVPDFPDSVKKLRRASYDFNRYAKNTRRNTTIIQP